MIIDSKRINRLFAKNLIFVWIPKTAGTSIFNYFYTNYGMKKILSKEEAQFTNIKRGMVTFGHMSVFDLLNCNFLNQKYFDSAIKFCVIRNPYDRFISLYYYFKREGRINSSLSKFDFITLIMEQTPKIGLFNFEGISQANLQVDWMRNISFDSILRFESINEDFTHFLESHNFILTDLSILNSTPSRQVFEKELDSQTIDLINEFYEKDFIELNYSMII